MNARLLLIPAAALLLFSLTGCKKDSPQKSLSLSEVFGSYEGEEKTTMTLTGREINSTQKITVTVEKSETEGIDGRISAGLVKVAFKVKENKGGKITFEFKGLLFQGEGYFTASELYYKRSFVTGTEEFKGSKR